MPSSSRRRRCGPPAPARSRRARAVRRRGARSSPAGRRWMRSLRKDGRPRRGGWRSGLLPRPRRRHGLGSADSKRALDVKSFVEPFIACPPSAPLRPGHRARTATAPIVLTVVPCRFQPRPMTPASRASSRCRKTLTAERPSGMSNVPTSNLPSLPHSLRAPKRFGNLKEFALWYNMIWPNAGAVPRLIARACRCKHGRAHARSAATVTRRADAKRRRRRAPVRLGYGRGRKTPRGRSRDWEPSASETRA